MFVGSVLVCFRRGPHVHRGDARGSDRYTTPLPSKRFPSGGALARLAYAGANIIPRSVLFVSLKIRNQQGAVLTLRKCTVPSAFRVATASDGKTGCL